MGRRSTIDDRRWTIMYRLWFIVDRPVNQSKILNPKSKILLCACVLVVSLSGCFLISGPTRSADSTAEGGNVYVSFVSAEGTQTETVQTNFVNSELDVTVFAQNQRGQLRVDVLDAQDSVVLTVQGQAQGQGQNGTIRTDAQGQFRYRLRATGAQGGSIEILYQPTGG
jgi:hypothetical protein